MAFPSSCSLHTVKLSCAFGLQHASAEMRKASMMREKLQEVHTWVGHQVLPKQLKGAIKAYYADVSRLVWRAYIAWFASVAVPPSLMLLLHAFSFCGHFLTRMFWLQSVKVLQLLKDVGCCCCCPQKGYPGLQCRLYRHVQPPGSGGPTLCRPWMISLTPQWWTTEGDRQRAVYMWLRQSWMRLLQLHAIQFGLGRSLQSMQASTP